MPRRRTRTDPTRTVTGQLLERILDALPAPSHREIADRTGIPFYRISICLAYLRKYCRAFGWTVPHAKRGVPRGEDKYFVVLVDGDGSFETDSITVDNTIYLHQGCIGTVSMLSTLGKNETNAITAYCSFLPQTSAIRTDLERVVDTVGFLSRMCGRLLPELNQMVDDLQRNGTTV